MARTEYASLDALLASATPGSTYIDPDWAPGDNPWQGPLVTIEGQAYEVGRGCRMARLRDLRAAVAAGRTTLVPLETATRLGIAGDAQPEGLYVYVHTPSTPRANATPVRPAAAMCPVCNMEIPRAGACC